MLSGTGGSLFMTGPGTQILAGANTYDVSTEVEAGTLVINGSIVTPVTVDPGATLAGRGSITGNVDVSPDGILSPGYLTTGSLTVNGDVTLSPGSIFQIHLLPPAGTASRLIVNGFVDLTDAILELDSCVAVTTNFTIISNDLADPVTGEFLGLPEGSTFVLDGRTYSITYVGGPGANDVIVTRIVNQLTWDGKGDDGTFPDDANWSNPLNWVGDNAPEAGDALIFPASAVQKVNFNDGGLRLRQDHVHGTAVTTSAATPLG